MRNLTPYPLIGGASLPALVQLHCPGLTIPRGERAHFTRSRDLDSHPIQHSFIQQKLIEELLYARFCVGMYPGYRIEPNIHAFLTGRSYQCS